jgi:hypothetical protein
MAGLPDGLVKQGLVAGLGLSAMHSDRVCYAKWLCLASEVYEEIICCAKCLWLVYKSLSGLPDGLVKQGLVTGLGPDAAQQLGGRHVGHTQLASTQRYIIWSVGRGLSIDL